MDSGVGVVVITSKCELFCRLKGVVQKWKVHDKINRSKVIS